MDTKEKLVELLNQGADNTPCSEECWDKKCNDCIREAQAEHLIAHGVTVQEDCKSCAEATQNCIVKLQEQIAELRSVQEWISVKDERKPQHGDIALCYMTFGEYRLLQWDDRSKLWVGDYLDYRFEDVAYWQMPQPPKGE